MTAEKIAGTAKISFHDRNALDTDATKKETIIGRLQLLRAAIAERPAEEEKTPTVKPSPRYKSKYVR